MKKLALIILLLSSIACGTISTPAPVETPISENHIGTINKMATSEPREMTHREIRRVMMWNCANPEGVFVLDTPNGTQKGVVYQMGETFAVYGYELILSDGSTWWMVDEGYVNADYICEYQPSPIDEIDPVIQALRNLGDAIAPPPPLTKPLACRKEWR